MRWRLVAVLFLASGAFAAEVRFPFKTLEGKDDAITLDRFQIHGHDPEATPKTSQIAGGVTEITIDTAKAGDWSFAIADDSSYYGFGERFDRLDHARTILANASRNMSRAKGTLTYQPIPFYMSLRGYGLWLDTTSEAVFDLNVTDASHILVKFFGSRLRVVMFEGPRFPAILDLFTALVGRQQLPPYWAFAPWKSRDYHRDQRDVYEDVDRYRKLGLPASVLMIDSPWATNYNTYEFNPKQFDDAKAMVGHIHDEGFKLVLWHTSWINRETVKPYEVGFADKLAPGPAANFAEAERAGYFVHRPDGSTYIGQWWKGIGALIDFTNAAARKWWQGQVAKAIDFGADGFKDDDAEGTFIGDVAFAGGEDQRIMRTRYAVDYNRAVAEVLQQRKGSDWVLFQRSGTVGSHMLPFFWSGDNDATFSTSNGLPTVVTAGLNAKPASIPGPNTAIALQAMAVGKSLVGMRADDVIRGVNWLVSLPDVDQSAITVYGRAAEGMAVLHAAVLDDRIGHVVVENTLVSYRMALDAPLHRNLSDIILPGALLHYDVGDLLRLISPRPVILVNPVDAMGLAARDSVAGGELTTVHTVRRGFRDPLPIE